MSRRLLAQIEAGEANPSLSTLLRIAEGFDTSLAELLADGAKPAVFVRTATADAPEIWSGDHGGEARMLVGSDPLEMWDWTLEPGDVRDADAHRSGSREALHVLAGTVTLTVGAADPVVLSRGGTALFRADEPHTYANNHKGAAHFLLAVHEPHGARA